MSNPPKISIIVPVYGVEQYIAKCLTSIQNQTFTDFECIVVDDGSPDNSIAIAKQLVGNDPRFIFLEKENGGQASARNMGLDYAKGDYIAFLDSDDYIAPNYLSELYNCLLKNSADIACCGINYIDMKGNCTKIFSPDITKFYQKNDYLLTRWFVSNFMWDKLFKREVFKGFRFDTSLRTNEDVHLLFRVLFGKQIASTNKVLYFYLQRPGSTSKDIPPSYLQDRIAIKNKQIEFAKKQDLYEKHKDYVVYAYLKTFVFYCSTHLARYSKNYNNDIKQLKAEIDPNLFTLKNILPIIKSEPKVGLSLLLFKISPKVFRYFVKFWFRNAVA